MIDRPPQSFIAAIYLLCYYILGWSGYLPGSCTRRRYDSYLLTIEMLSDCRDESLTPFISPGPDLLCNIYRVLVTPGPADIECFGADNNWNGT